MKLKYVLPFTFLFLFSHVSFSQLQFTQQKKIPLNASFISADNLGNIYAVADGNLLKYDASGNFINTYSNKKLGRITSIDATNALRILVYTKDFAVVYVFDGSLAQQSSINLRELNFSDPQLICSSSSSSFWVYDRATTILTKLYENLTIASQSQPLNLTVKEDLNPLLIRERDNWLVMLNENDGFIVFDKSGSYFKKIPCDSTTKNFSMNDTYIYFLKGNQLQSINIKTGIEGSSELNSVFENAEDFVINNQKLIVRYKDEIGIYTLPEK